MSRLTLEAAPAAWIKPVRARTTHPGLTSDWVRVRAQSLAASMSDFAVGDVRAGSVKRVASGEGEGSVAIRMIHHYLDGH
jgi:hypothetical protein